MEENHEKIFPFPIEFIHTPHLKHITSSAMGCYIRLICDYWLTGYDLPKTDNKFTEATNVNRAVWRRVKPEVLEALRVTLPKIVKRREEEKRQYIYRLKRLKPSIDALMKYNDAKRRDKAEPITDSMQSELKSQPNKQLPYDGEGRSDQYELRKVRAKAKLKKPLNAVMRDK